MPLKDWETLRFAAAAPLFCAALLFGFAGALCLMGLESMAALDCGACVCDGVEALGDSAELGGGEVGVSVGETSPDVACHKARLQDGNAAV